MLGYKPEEIIGKKHFYDFFHPDIKEQFKDAFSLLKAIRNSDLLNTIPVIALTASEIGRDVVKNQKLNIDEYIVKPIDGKQLLECLRNLKIY